MYVAQSDISRAHARGHGAWPPYTPRLRQHAHLCCLIRCVQQRLECQCACPGTLPVAMAEFEGSDFEEEEAVPQLSEEEKGEPPPCHTACQT